MKLRNMFAGLLFFAANSVNASLILSVDLSTLDTISLTATSADSSATISGRDFLGFYLASFFFGKTSSITNALVSGDLTSAENTSDGTPRLFSSGSNAGLNVWNYTDDASSTFVSGNRALQGSGTWTVDNASYLAALAGPSSGDVYFVADSDDAIAGATVVGQWGKVSNDVPAPATLALFGLGLAGLGWSRRKKA